MKNNELIIEIPEGMEIDKEHSTFEKIVFKKKYSNRPTRWEDIEENISGWYVRGDSIIDYAEQAEIVDNNKNIWPTKELAEADLAKCQLVRLRNEWVNGWEPDWNNEHETKYCLCYYYNVGVKDSSSYTLYHLLSFPTPEMTQEFLETFRDLLEVAKYQL